MPIGVHKKFMKCNFQTNFKTNFKEIKIWNRVGNKLFLGVFGEELGGSFRPNQMSKEIYTFLGAKCLSVRIALSGLWYDFKYWFEFHFNQNYTIRAKISNNSFRKTGFISPVQVSILAGKSSPNKPHSSFKNQAMRKHHKYFTTQNFSFCLKYISSANCLKNHLHNFHFF